MSFEPSLDQIKKINEVCSTNFEKDLCRELFYYVNLNNSIEKKYNISIFPDRGCNIIISSIKKDFRITLYPSIEHEGMFTLKIDCTSNTLFTYKPIIDYCVFTIHRFSVV